MCGRYTVTSPIEVIADLFEVAHDDEHPLPEMLQRFNLAPTQEAPVVRVADPAAGRELALLRWGLIPYWAKESSIGNRMINARAESAAEKPAYRAAFKKNRCLVVTDGFYEWKKVAGGKQPYYIRKKDQKPFAFAGLWSRWQPPPAEIEKLGPRPVETFTILTTAANEWVSPLHDRMPVILAPEDYDRWLDPKTQDAEKLQPLLVPLTHDDLEFVPVSRRVNSPAHDAPDCVAPLTGEGGG